MKKGLGRGFEALIPTELVEEMYDPTADQDGKVSQLKEIKMDLVQADPGQPRRFFEEKALEELAASIKQHGIVQPIVVISKGGKYTIVAGERRFKAAQMLGLETIPALVRKLSDQHRLEISLIENLQRRDLNPIETATAYLKLRNQFNMTLEQIGERVGNKSISAVSNTLRLLKLPKKAQEAVFEGRLSEGQARPLIGLPDKVINQLIKRIEEEDWSSRRIEQWITLWKQQDKEKKTQSKLDNERPHAKALDELSLRFKAGVDIRTNARGAGRIVIPFKDAKDFERIRQLLG